jgi:CRISPR-associated DxTHG motif protein
MGVTGDKTKMKVISFLGTTDYSETTYYFAEKSCSTRFFPAAVTKFFTPEKIMICATPIVAKHKNMEDLSGILDSWGIPLDILKIPEGRSESELWEIFDIITGSVKEGDRVIFDVTHSFRSLPMLTFLVVAYLKVARTVHVEKVLYGAWEARDQKTNRTPVFDLSPFISLLDWLAATNRFIETGDGHSLATLLKQGMPSGTQMSQDLDMRQLGTNLKYAAGAIESVSLALSVARPIETMQAAKQLEDSLKKSLPHVLRSAQPFAVLANQVIEEYSQFSLADPTGDDLLEGLQRQLAMIEWYIKRLFVIQATTLAREWVVSVLAYHLRSPIFDHKNGRNEVEQALNNAVERKKKDPKIRNKSRFDKQFQKIPDANRITCLWNRLNGLRRDIAHVGMRLDPKSAEQLKTKITNLQPELIYLSKILLNRDQGPYEESR